MFKFNLMLLPVVAATLLALFGGVFDSFLRHPKMILLAGSKKSVFEVFVSGVNAKRESRSKRRGQGEEKGKQE